MEKIKNSIASLFVKAGISANCLTYLGLICAFGSGLMIYQGQFFLGGGVLLLSGFFDLMDGAVARQSKKATVFGGILDSSLDRYGDGFVLIGVILFYARQSNTLYALLAASAVLGSFLISYVRARAECAVTKCKVGFWERGERIVYLATGLILNNLGLVLSVLAVFTHWTFFSRLYFSKKEAECEDYWERQNTPVLSLLFPRQGRAHWAYFIKIFVLLLAVFLIRLPA